MKNVKAVYEVTSNKFNEGIYEISKNGKTYYHVGHINNGKEIGGKCAHIVDAIMRLEEMVISAIADADDNVWGNYNNADEQKYDSEVLRSALAEIKKL